jgi:hypothetical protein
MEGVGVEVDDEIDGVTVDTDLDPETDPDPEPETDVKGAGEEAGNADERGTFFLDIKRFARALDLGVINRASSGSSTTLDFRGVRVDKAAVARSSSSSTSFKIVGSTGNGGKVNVANSDSVSGL